MIHQLIWPSWVDGVWSSYFSMTVGVVKVAYVSLVVRSAAVVVPAATVLLHSTHASATLFDTHSADRRGRSKTRGGLLGRYCSVHVLALTNVV